MFEFFVEHLLGHIPIWIWPFVVGLSIGAYFILGIATLAPAYKNYVPIVRAVCVVAILYSMFMFGAEGCVNVYKMKQIKDQQVVAVGTQQSTDTNRIISDDLQHKQDTVKERTIVVTKIIHDNAGKIDADCKLNDAAWDAYNAAVTGGNSK